jgi:folate-binding Fe-S cluster repair protein YgfZ
VSGTVVQDQGYSALWDGYGALRLGRDIVRVAGPDAQSYLQGQTSQDVAKLGDGGWGWSLVLQPQGKLDAFVRVFRRGRDEFLLDTDAGMGAPLVARLGRFKLRTKVDSSIGRLWRCAGRSAPSSPHRSKAPQLQVVRRQVVQLWSCPSNGAGLRAMTCSARAS